MAKLTWRGKEVLDKLAGRASEALTVYGLAAEGASKAYLVPGRGKRTGTLQRSVQAISPRREGLKVVGGHKTAGVRYAQVIDRRYGYMAKGAEAGRPRLAAALRGRP